MQEPLKNFIKFATNLHKPDGSPNVFVFATPRGGSTWLAELILSQPTFKAIDEPLNLEYEKIRNRSGIYSWQALYDESATAALHTYFEGICSGKLHFKDTNFRHNKHYRFLTRRIVFKMLRGGGDRINWFRDTFNGRIVFLVRHPIAVSLSRKELWRLDAFMTSDYKEHFTNQQLAFAEKIVRSGSHLERATLHWCFEVAVPLKQMTDDWAVISYEQLVVDPAPVLRELARKLELPALHLMEEQLHVASNSTYKSDEKTQQMLSGAYERDYLIKKWQDKVTPEEERRVMEILACFELDTYSAGDALPNRRLWIR